MSAQTQVSDQVKEACRKKCESGKYETGQGTCALICMEENNPRSIPGGCPKAVAVFRHTLEALRLPHWEDD
jgi:hypothetical protein